MSLNRSDPLEVLQCFEANVHLIQTLRHIEKEYSSVCLLEERDLSRISHYLDTLQRVEEEYGSFRVFSDNTHLLETVKRIQQEGGSSETSDVTSTLERIAAECYSFHNFVDRYLSSEGYRPLDTLLEMSAYYWRSFSGFPYEEDLLDSFSLRKTLQQIEEKCDSLHDTLDELRPKRSNLLLSLQHIEEVWGSFRMYSDKLQSKISNFLETQRSIGKECVSFLVLLEIYLPLDSLQSLDDDELDLFDIIRSGRLFLVDRIKLLKRDFKFLGIILNLNNFKDEPRIIKKAQALFRDAVNDLIFLRRYHMDDFLSDLQRKFLNTKLEIRKTRYSFPEISFQLLVNKDGIVIPNFVMKFIDTVVENLNDLLKFNDPSSPLCIGGPMMGQIEKALEELKFLKSFVCFVSDRCIEPQSQHTFFNHILQVAWHTTMLAWLYFPSKGYEGSPQDEINSLFSELLDERIQPTEPSICKIYTGVLQALKLVQSQWYPIIQIKYMVDCEVGFVDTLLHNLEELPISSNFIAIKETLKEMLNLLRVNLINLPVQVPVFHLQHIDSVIVDVGLLVYSSNNEERDKEDTTLGEANQVLVLDFPSKILSMQATIYLITRKSFLLPFNLHGIDEQGTTDSIVDNLKELLSLSSNSTDSVKSQLQTIQNELKCFQAVVEQDGRCRHFATRAIGLAHELEYIIDIRIEEAVPDWCLFLWILHIGSDIRLVMAEVAEIQEKNVSNLVLHNTEDAAIAHTSSQHSGNLTMNQEMVGLLDVMDELRGKLIEGSSSLDVISIVGMPGKGKTTLAKKVYFDQQVIFRFDIRAQCCVSQEYSRKELLRTILGDITEDTTELEGKAEDELADKLRKLLMFKRYLIFIDDIWEASVWDDLSPCFYDVNNGSRIILTTRNHGVASYAKHVSDPLDLRFLSDEESWILFQNKVFNKESCPLVLKDVGKSIAQKCGGLPLSIVLVAGILARLEKERHCWEQMVTELSQYIQAQSEHTIDLSYKYLPPHLRICFLYFAVFSEDKEIQVSKLTWLWISEGFVKTHTEKLLEDIAEDYIENLVERNLLMVSKRSFDGKIKACHMHDLLLEFCKKKAESNNFVQRIKGYRGVDPSHVFPAPKYRTPRRLFLHTQCDNLKKWCFSFSHVKSFQFREVRNIAYSSIDRASDTFKMFKFLRVLDFEFTMIDSFPQELTLLRYLAFRTVEDALLLPVNLLNLETLIVQGVRGRVSVPDTLWEMVKLRHLHIYDQAFFTSNNGEEFSESSSTMDDLQTISSACFSCVKNADKILEKTPNLRKLRCEVSKFDGSFPAFSNLTKLEILKISSGTRLTLINKLKFPSQLKKLTLSNFNIHLNEVATLPELEVLKLLGVTISSNKWEVTDEQFPHLKFLKLENPSISEWHASDDAFPCLEHLVLKRCRYLKVIPSRFEDSSSLKSVEIISSNEALVRSALAVRETLIENSGTSGFEIIVPK